MNKLFINGPSEFISGEEDLNFQSRIPISEFYLLNYHPKKFIINKSNSSIYFYKGGKKYEEKKKYQQLLLPSLTATLLGFVP